jgi:20S proteasome subunit beta 6
MLGFAPEDLKEARAFQAPLEDYHNGATQRRFYPYAENHGSVVAVAGDDFAVIASDSRLSDRYTILTREQSKLFQLTDKSVLGSTGCWCDVLTFTRVAAARIKMYYNTHAKPVQTPALAQMIATMLYSKRFFPYYISNIVAGLDAAGAGVVYSYDPVGHVEKHTYRAGGSSVALLQPLMDNQVGKKNQSNTALVAPTLAEAVDLVHDLFVSAAEREIHTGDAIVFKIITKDGIEDKTVPLRRD